MVLHNSKILPNIASLNRDTMNELFILFCFLLVMIPILIGTQAFENMIKGEEEDQL
jgi:hypothetical protein